MSFSSLFLVLIVHLMLIRLSLGSFNIEAVKDGHIVTNRRETLNDFVLVKSVIKPDYHSTTCYLYNKLTNTFSMV